MARIIDLFTPALTAQKQRARAEWYETLRRLKMLRGRGLFGPDYAFKPGPEFTEARDVYRGLAATPEVSDVSGEQDLNAAERAALMQEREQIAGQGAQAQKELQNIVGRMGGGGSEFQEMAGNIGEAMMAARVQALRDVLGRAQATREAAKTRRLSALTTAGGGLAGLAGMREQAGQFGARLGTLLTQQRLAMLQSLMPSLRPSPSSEVSGEFSRNYNFATSPQAAMESRLRYQKLKHPNLYGWL